MKISNFCIEILSTMDPTEEVYVTMSKTYTAQDLIEGLKNRDEFALTWATSLAQITVGFLERNKTSKSESIQFEATARDIGSAIFIKLLEQLHADEQRVVFFNGVKKYSRDQMIEEFKNNSSVCIEYACAFLNWTSKLIRNS